MSDTQKLTQDAVEFERLISVALKEQKLRNKADADAEAWAEHVVSTVKNGILKFIVGCFLMWTVEFWTTHFGVYHDVPFWVYWLCTPVEFGVSKYSRSGVRCDPTGNYWPSFVILYIFMGSYLFSWFVK